MKLSFIMAVKLAILRGSALTGAISLSRCSFVRTRRMSTRWPFEQFRESLNFAIGYSSHAEERWQNVHVSLNAIGRAVGVVLFQGFTDYSERFAVRVAHF